MKTLCAWDNVACIVDNFPQSLGLVYLPGVVILGALAITYALASYLKGN
jgi:hypothetical protein